MDDDSSIGSLFVLANKGRRDLDRLPSSSTEEYQQSLEATIRAYERCYDVVHRTSLFSSNENVEDIATNDIQYIYRSNVRDHMLKRTTGSRKAHLRQAQSYYSDFLQELSSYDILSKNYASLLENFSEEPNAFSITTSEDPSARRQAKISRFQQEKALKQKLAALQADPGLTQDENIARELFLQQIALAVLQTFQSLESIAQEVHIISLAPPEQPPGFVLPGQDGRDRQRTADGYSERLDGPLSQLSSGLKGPLLNAKGRPLRPFTLLDKRQQLQAGVFRPDHNLPTMSIDEYLDEERRRGGIIEGGGPQSGMRPEPDEDDIEKADAETIKARAWDEFKEDNPKGSGNTLNRG